MRDALTACNGSKVRIGECAFIRHRINCDHRWRKARLVEIDKKGGIECGWFEYLSGSMTEVQIGAFQCDIRALPRKGNIKGCQR